MQGRNSDITFFKIEFLCKVSVIKLEKREFNIFLFSIAKASDDLKKAFPCPSVENFLLLSKFDLGIHLENGIKNNICHPRS